MALSLIWAALLGACLGLDRNLRDLKAGWAPCAFWATLAAVIGIELQLSPLAENMWFWPIAFAACAVSIAKYLTLTMTIGGWRLPSEPAHALVAACGFGLASGLGANRLVGIAVLATIFALAWRPRISDSLRVAAQSPSDAAAVRIAREIVEVGRRAEEGRHDEEGRQEREEQGNGEQLAHSGRAGVR